MRPKSLLVILTVVSIISLFTTCKKYPEGGYEKDGPKHFIYNWKLTLYEVDGLDSTELINYHGTEDYKTVLCSGNSKIGYIAHPGGSSACDMAFSSSNEILTGTVNPYKGANICYTYCVKEIFTPETNTGIWKILKLDSKEWHIQSQQIHSYNLKFIRTN